MTAGKSMNAGTPPPSTTSRTVIRSVASGGLDLGQLPDPPCCSDPAMIRRSGGTTTARSSASKVPTRVPFGVVIAATPVGAAR